MRILFIISLFIFSNLAFSQSAKKIKKNKISELKEVVSDGSGENFTECVIKYDNKGNEIYHEEYNSKRKLKKKFEREYTSFNEISKEKIYDGNGELFQIIETKFDLELPVEELTFDKSNKLIERKEVKHNGFKEKVEEKIFNEKGELFETVIYEYNNKGLKTAKRRYDKAGKLIESKEYIYQYDK